MCAVCSCWLRRDWLMQFSKTFIHVTMYYFTPAELLLGTYVKFLVYQHTEPANIFNKTLLTCQQIDNNVLLSLKHTLVLAQQTLCLICGVRLSADILTTRWFPSRHQLVQWAAVCRYSWCVCLCTRTLDCCWNMRTLKPNRNFRILVWYLCCKNI